RASTARERSAGASAASAPGRRWPIPPLSAGTSHEQFIFEKEPRLERGSFSFARSPILPRLRLVLLAALFLQLASCANAPAPAPTATPASRPRDAATAA